MDTDTELETLADSYSHSLTLRFEGARESDFIRQSGDQLYNHSRFSIYIGIAIYLFSGTLDLILLDDRVLEIWKIRYPVFLPMLLIIGLTSYFGVFKRCQQFVMCLFVVVVGAAMIRIVDATTGGISQVYFSGLLLTQMAGLTAMRMRFHYALLTTACIALMFGMYFGFASTEGLRIIVADIYLFSGMALFSLMSNYFLERSQRLSYLKRELIAHKQEELTAANIQLEALASTDGLTGISNRRTFDMELAREWSRAYREKTPVSLLMVDIDFFKKYNDTYGHQSGDRCLHQVASELARFANRAGDCAARYGGEEFALILPSTTLANAQWIAAKVIAAVEALDIPHSASSVAAYVTISAGVSTMVPESCNEESELISLADNALYTAKEAGRNQYAAPQES